MTEGKSETTADNCMWCRYGDSPAGPVCPIHGGLIPEEWDRVPDNVTDEAVAALVEAKIIETVRYDGQLEWRRFCVYAP